MSGQPIRLYTQLIQEPAARLDRAQRQRDKRGGKRLSMATLSLDENTNFRRMIVAFRASAEKVLGSYTSA
jgi:hypothetical protein